MANRRSKVHNAYESTLSSAMNTTQMTADVVSAGPVSADTYLCIEPLSNTNREYIYVASVAGNVLTLGERYLVGSAAPSGLSHASGAVVRSVTPQQMWEDLHDRHEAHLGGALTTDHPEATTSVRGFMSAADKTKLNGIAPGAVSDHDLLTGVSADDHHSQDHEARHRSGGADPLSHANLAGLLTGDPHTQYHNDARHDARQLIYHGHVAMLRSGGLQSIPNATRTVVTYDGSIVDNDPANHMTASLTGTITINTAGVYMLSAGIRFQDAITSGLIIYALYVGLDSHASQSLMGVTGLGAPLMSISRTLGLNATNVVTAEILHNAGSARDIDAGFDTYFEAVRLR